MKYVKCIGVFILAFSVQMSMAEDVTQHSVSASHSAGKEKLDIRITNAFIYVPLGGSKTTTGFFTIDNRSSSEASITEVNSSFAKQIKLMPKPVLVVPAHESLTLNPTGYFLHINDLKTRLSTGDELHLSISLSNGQTLHIIAVAKSAYDQSHDH